jgi:menaquinol-cytochrome c reductase iron-sulfur subunit
MADQDRRTFLRWATTGLGALFAVVLGVPAVAYLIGPRRRSAGSDDDAGFTTVALFSELQPGVPREVVVRNMRRDAWTLHPNEVLGRAFLIRRGDSVEALSVTCPHYGCSINHAGEQFLCPCHGARFNLQGQRENDRSPVDMYRLVVRRNPDNRDEIQMNGRRLEQA